MQEAHPQRDASHKQPRRGDNSGAAVCKEPQQPPLWGSLIRFLVIQQLLSHPCSYFEILILLQYHLSAGVTGMCHHNRLFLTSCFTKLR
ncbi:hypothetical protein LEMLEM_LOCUS26330, partial [Lemmus lemmus]